MVKQERPYYCGPASLRIVQRLAGFKRLLTQREWAFLAKTTKNGTGPVGIKRGLSFMRLRFYVLRAAEPFHTAIVYDPSRDHWVVAERRQNGTVAIHDPWTGRTTRTDWETFKTVMGPDPYALSISI